MILLTEPKTKRGQETLRRIYKAAEELFSSKGFHHTSINDIAQQARIAPGTFYIYFKDKKSVFKYLIEYLNKSLRAEIAQAVKGCSSRFEEEHKGFKAFFSFLNQHQGLFKIIWEAQFVDEQVFKDYYETFSRGYAQRLAEAQAKGEVRQGLDVTTLAYFFMGIVNFIGLKWIIFDKSRVDDKVIDDLMQVIRHGVFK